MSVLLSTHKNCRVCFEACFFTCGLQAEIAVLRNTNHELTHKLAMQTQRLELVGVYNTQSVPITPSESAKSYNRNFSSDGNVEQGAENLDITESNVLKLDSIAPITRTDNRGDIVKNRWSFW